jgi:hypothetical protein
MRVDPLVQAHSNRTGDPWFLLWFIPDRLEPRSRRGGRAGLFYAPRFANADEGVTDGEQVQKEGGYAGSFTN